MSVRKKMVFLTIFVLLVILGLFGNDLMVNFTYTTLYNDLDSAQTGTMQAALSEAGINSVASNSASTLSVPSGSKEQAYVVIAQAGIAPDGTNPYEDYLNSVSWATTDSDRAVLLQQLIETEIALSLENLGTVNEATVNLYIAEDSIWLENQEASSASVVVDLTTPSLTNNQLQAIQALVAGKVTNLDQEDVEVIDSAGNLLTTGMLDDSDYDLSDLDYQMKYQATFARQIETQIEAMLDIVYGKGNYFINLYVDINFDKSQITEINYGDGSYTSREITYDSQTGSDFNNDSPTAENTEPVDEDTATGSEVTVDASADDVSISGVMDADEYLNIVENWNVDQKTTQTILVPGEIEGLSISVVLNGQYTTEEHEQAASMIMAGVVFDDNRDTINVTSREFADTGTTTVVEVIDYYFGIAWLTLPILISIVGILLLIIILIIAFIVIGGRRRRHTIQVTEQLNTVIGDDSEIDENVSIDASNLEHPNIAESEIDIDVSKDENSFVEDKAYFTKRSTDYDKYINVDVSDIIYPDMSSERITQKINTKDDALRIIDEYIAITQAIFTNDIDLGISTLKLMYQEDGENNSKSVNGYNQAAHILIIIGAELSSEVLRRLEEDEMVQLAQEISFITKINSDKMLSVLLEFATIFNANKYMRQGGIAYTRKLLIMTIGEAAAEKLLDKITKNANSPIRVPFKSIRKMDAEQIISIISNEHPQTISLILAYVDPQRAAQVLARLPHDQQVEVASRIAVMKVAQSNVIEAIEGVVEERITSISNSQFTDVGGIPTMVNILNSIERSAQKNILEGLAEKDETLAYEIRDKLFVFDDIIRISDTDIQRILRDVEQKTLAVALKGVSDELSEKIMGNLSKRAKEMLLEEIEYLGPVRVSEIETSQSTVVALVRDLEESGEISISQEGDEDAFIY